MKIKSIEVDTYIPHDWNINVISVCKSKLKKKVHPHIYGQWIGVEKDLYTKGQLQWVILELNTFENISVSVGCCLGLADTFVARKFFSKYLKSLLKLIVADFTILFFAIVFLPRQPVKVQTLLTNK